MKALWPDLPFMDRMGVVFLAALALAVIVSLLQAGRAERNLITTGTSASRPRRASTSARSASSLILVALYATWW